jgi:hypothetical protein
MAPRFVMLLGEDDQALLDTLTYRKGPGGGITQSEEQVRAVLANRNMTRMTCKIALGRRSRSILQRS